MITFECPGCKARIEVPDQYQGRQARCPTCSRKLRVPRRASGSGGGGGNKDDSLPVDESGSGANVVMLDGRAYQVRPQLEGFALAAAIVVGMSILALLIIGLTVRVYNPWLWAGISAAAVALFGVLLILPAQVNIARSHGRKGGQLIANITLAAGGLLIGLYLTVALLSSLWADYSPCPERLRTVYRGLVAYAEAHGGSFPSEPEALVEEGLIPSEALTCPEAAGARAGSATYLRDRSGQNVIPWQYLDFESHYGQRFPDDLIILFGGTVHRLSDGRRVYFVLLKGGDVRHVSQEMRDEVIKGQRERIAEVLEARREASGGNRSTDGDGE